MAKAKKKAKKGKAARAAKPKRKPAAKAKKKVAAKPKPKRKAPAKKKPTGAPAAETARLREEVARWQQLHSQLQEQIRAKDSTIGMQMQEIMDLKKKLEELQPSP